MVVDFQHHYVPVDLAKKRGLYSDKTTYLQESGRRATTMHARLYDLQLQLKDMSEAGIDVSMLSCLLGWNASLDECRLINDDLAKVQRNTQESLLGSPERQSWRAKAVCRLCTVRFRASGRSDLYSLATTRRISRV
jgi:hypothetical protein